ncbi:hypothetical protein CF335_g8260 [Tilletia laevis]|nr:hypothetical protein CF335_g8260 [Tilletia laevis]
MVGRRGRSAANEVDPSLPPPNLLNPPSSSSSSSANNSSVQKQVLRTLASTPLATPPTHPGRRIAIKLSRPQKQVGSPAPSATPAPTDSPAPHLRLPPPPPFDYRNTTSHSPEGDDTSLQSAAGTWPDGYGAAAVQEGDDWSAIDPGLRSQSTNPERTSGTSAESMVGMEDGDEVVEDDGLGDYERKQRQGDAVDPASTKGGSGIAAMNVADGDDPSPTAALAVKQKKGNGRHQWTKAEREQLLEFMKHIPEEKPLEPIQVRRQIEAMDAKYEIALALLSETRRRKTASEVPEHGFLRQERAGAISKCWYFEDWHEMRRDRRSSAPSRVRVGGGEGSVAVTKAGIRDAEDDEFSEDNEDVGKGKRKETSTSGAEDSDVRTAKKAKTEKSSTSAPKRSAAGLSKRSHASSTAVDDLAASMKDSMQEREARASAREEKKHNARRNGTGSRRNAST